MRLPGCNVCNWGSACQNIQIFPGRCLSLEPDTQRTAAVDQCNQPGSKGWLKTQGHVFSWFCWSRHLPQMLTGKISAKITFSDGDPQKHKAELPVAHPTSRSFWRASGFYFWLLLGHVWRSNSNRSKAKIHHLPIHLPRPLWSHQMWHCYPFIIGLNHCCWVLFFFFSAKTQFIVLQFWRSEVLEIRSPKGSYKAKIKLWAAGSYSFWIL